MKKYELTANTIEYYGKTLYQIKALKDFENVHTGDLGGYIESENNLSQEGNAWVYSNAKVCGNAEVFGNAKVCGNAEVFGNAEVYETNHILTIGPIGSRNDTTIFFRNKDRKINVKCGCFRGDIDEFLTAVYKTHGNNKHAQVYKLAAEMAKLQIDLVCDITEDKKC